jgi:hypothetical protein
MQKLRDRLVQVEDKLAIVVTEVIKLRNEVRLLRGSPVSSTIDLTSESYTVSSLSTETSPDKPQEVQE